MLIQKLLHSSKTAMLCALLFFTCFAQDKLPVQQDQNNSPKQIFLSVTVTNKQGQILRELSKESFSLFDEDKQQEISFFNEQDMPVSIGFLIDTSASMEINGSITGLPVLEIVKKLLPEFVKQSNASNEYFLMTFSKQAQLAVDWTQNKNAIADGATQIIPAQLSPTQAGTGFYNACTQAIAKSVQGRNRKRAIIVFTDGVDTESDSNRGELKKLVQKMDAMIYVIGIFHAGTLNSYGQSYSRGFLKEIAEISGGELYAPANENGIVAAFSTILTDIKTQYSIGFRPATLDKKWHSIKIKVSPVEVTDKAKPGSSPQKITPTVRTRKGYVAN